MPSGVYERRPAIERFLEKIERQDSGCWFWTAAIQNMGYGLFNVGGRKFLAHRFAYEYFKGTIPDGCELDHLCRNTNCVSPNHLEAVTHAENNRRGNGGGFHPTLTNAVSNKSKTHCPHGHPYNKENTYYWNNQRQCRICRKEHRQQLRQRRINNGYPQI